MEVLVVAPGQGRTPSLGAALSPETQQPGVPRGRAARCHARSPPSREGTAAVEPPVSADPRCLSSGAGRRALGQQLPAGGCGERLRVPAGPGAGGGLCVAATAQLELELELCAGLGAQQPLWGTAGGPSGEGFQ